ncbi:MAG: PIN domain-containing protein [Synergistaceae bacterium]|jgi:predicted nucleic acid-binding protein|nr:PIN domain-containing protein [Synergistaceae bacterium]
MNVLIDTNVVLDVLLRREPYYKDSMRVIVLSEKKYIDGIVSASAITDIYYIVRKAIKNRDFAIDLLKRLTKVIGVGSVIDRHIYEALELEWDDFEDSIQYVVGKSIGVEYIVTRNPQDFSAAAIRAISPQEFLRAFASGV